MDITMLHWGILREWLIPAAEVLTLLTSCVIALRFWGR